MSGLLHFTLNESKSYKYIEIRFHGGALVKWTVGDGDSQHTYKSEETYVHKSRILWSSNRSPSGTIGPGTFDLPFQFVVPPIANRLGSFRGSVGSISYTLHGLIKTGTGMLHRSHRIQVPIQVNRIMEISLPQLLVPVHESKKKKVGFFYFGSVVEFTVSLSRTGFCIGHSLPLTVSIINGSSRHIKMRAAIQRNCCYYAQGHTNREKRVLAAVVTHDIAPHSQQTGMTIENLVVPMVEPSFYGSQIIKMQYFLKVTAVIPWARNSSVKIPITLGNVPLNNAEYHSC